MILVQSREKGEAYVKYVERCSVGTQTALRQGSIKVDSFVENAHGSSSNVRHHEQKAASCPRPLSFRTFFVCMRCRLSKQNTIPPTKVLEPPFAAIEAQS